MKRSKILNIAAISTLVLAAGAGTALADSEGGAWKIFSREIGNGKPAIRIDIAVSSEVEAALEKGDYAAWQAAVGEDHPWTGQITEDNFARFAEAWRLHQAGDFEGARAIYQELGISGMGLFMGRGMMVGRVDNETKIKMAAALENSDWAAWQEAVGDNYHPWANQITEDNFVRFAEAWRLKQAGDMAGAQAIYDELGLEGRGFMMMRQDKMMLDEDTKAQIETAINNGDYAAWQAAVGENHPWADQVNEDNFARFAEAWKLQQAGDFEGAKAIYDELGIEMKMKGRMHMFINDSDEDDDTGDERGVRSGMGLGLFGGWGQHQGR